MCLKFLVNICEAFYKMYGPNTSVHSLSSNITFVDSNLQFINYIGSRLLIDLRRRPTQVTIDGKNLTTNPLNPKEHCYTFSTGIVTFETHKKFLKFKNDNYTFYIDPYYHIEYNNEKYLLVLTEEPESHEDIREIYERFKKENSSLNIHSLAYNDRGVVIVSKGPSNEKLSIHWYRSSTSEFISDFENNEEGVFINTSKGLFFTIKTENNETIMTINGKPGISRTPSTLVSGKYPEDTISNDYLLFVRGYEKV